MAKIPNPPEPDRTDTKASELPAGLDRRALKAWEAFVYAHAAAIRRIGRLIDERGAIPLAWYDVLTGLSEAPGRRLRLSDLADEVVLSRSGLTRMVDRLERAGLVRREPCVEDARGAWAVLTEAGLSAVEATWPVYAQGIHETFGVHLAPEEAEVVTRFLTKVRLGDR